MTYHDTQEAKPFKIQNTKHSFRYLERIMLLRKPTIKAFQYLLHAGHHYSTFSIIFKSSEELLDLLNEFI